MDVRKIKLFATILFFASISFSCFGQKRISDIPKEKQLTYSFGTDIVPDQETAIKMADVILKKRYPPLRNYEDMPLVVKPIVNGKVWEVTLTVEKDSLAEKTYTIRINKNTGEVLAIWFTH